MNTPGGTPPVYTLPDPNDDRPLPEGGPLAGFLFILKKAHRALHGHDAAERRFAQVKTRGHARKYMEELMPELLEERRKRRKARV
jgi:hypothetical protein